jgi:hypothetical protein
MIKKIIAEILYWLGMFVFVILLFNIYYMYGLKWVWISIIPFIILAIPKMMLEIK